MPRFSLKFIYLLNFGHRLRICKKISNLVARGLLPWQRILTFTSQNLSIHKVVSNKILLYDVSRRVESMYSFGFWIGPSGAEKYRFFCFGPGPFWKNRIEPNNVSKKLFDLTEILHTYSLGCVLWKNHWTDLVGPIAAEIWPFEGLWLVKNAFLQKIIDIGFI